MHAKITNQKQQLLTYQPKPTKAPKKIKEITPKDLALVQWQIEIQKTTWVDAWTDIGIWIVATILTVLRRHTSFWCEKNDYNFWSFHLTKRLGFKHTYQGGFHVQGTSIEIDQFKILGGLCKYTISLAFWFPVWFICGTIL